MSVLKSNKTDPNKILPIRYKWAREHYKSGVANNWVPEEVPMQMDIEQWKSSTVLDDDERRLILWNLGFFSTAESLTANNIVLAVYQHVTDPACRQYLLRQAYEEAIHTDTFIYCCDSLGLDPEDIYTMYQTIPSIKDKDDFVVKLTQSIFNRDFEIRYPSTKPSRESFQSEDSYETAMLAHGCQVRDFHGDIQEFLHDLIGYYVIMEGIFFYAGFAMMLALKRQKKMIGVGEQFEFIMRDESVHLAFGCDLINTIKEEYPDIWTKDFCDEIQDLIAEAVELEKKYAHDACPKSLFGINAEQFSHYVEYIADRRLERLGLSKLYNTKNPFPWMSQSTDLTKEKNFFETTVTEYQNSGELEW